MFESLFSEAGLSLDRLRSFLSIAEARGIMAAARGDANRQSQLSRQLAELEAFFGTPLVVRGKRTPFSLTESGEALKTTLIQVFGSLEAIRLQAGGAELPLRVGAGESVLAWLVLPRLGNLREKHPRVVPHCLNLRSSDIVKRLEQGSLDLGIVRRPILAKNLKCVRLGTCGYTLAIPTLLAKSAPAAKLLTSLPLAVLDDSSSLEELESAARGERLNIACRCTSYAQVRAAVLSRQCAALVPDFMAEDLKHPACKMVQLPNMKLSLTAVWNPTSLKSRPSSQTVVDWAVKQWLKLDKFANG